MKWFKHLSNARNDEKIAALEDKTGIEGYGFYFKLMEIVAEKMDETDIHEATYSLRTWGRQLNISSKKCSILFQCCFDVGLITLVKVKENITIKITKLLNCKDEYTKKLRTNSGQTPDKLRTNSGQTPDTPISIPSSTPPLFSPLTNPLSYPHPDSILPPPAPPQAATSGVSEFDGIFKNENGTALQTVSVINNPSSIYTTPTSATMTPWFRDGAKKVLDHLNTACHWSHDVDDRVLQAAITPRLQKLVQSGKNEEQAVAICCEIGNWWAWALERGMGQAYNLETVYQKRFSEISGKYLVDGKFVAPKPKKTDFKQAVRDTVPQQWRCTKKDILHSSREEWENCFSCHPQRKPAMPLTEEQRQKNMENIKNISSQLKSKKKSNNNFEGVHARY